jgi:copper oxidase (laccase) domain-containing protein
MGPAIGGCCYEVGEDVVVPFRSVFHEPGEADRIFGSRAGRTTIDLAAANAALAARSGLAPERIHAAAICTSCRRDLCWSYRAEGRGTGRMWTIAGRSPGE